MLRIAVTVWLGALVGAVVLLLIVMAGQSAYRLTRRLRRTTRPGHTVRVLAVPAPPSPREEVVIDLRALERSHQDS